MEYHTVNNNTSLEPIKNPPKRGHPAGKVAIPLFLGLTGAAIFAALKLQKKISAQAAALGGATCAAAALIGSVSLGNTTPVPSYLSVTEFLEKKVLNKEMGEVLDLSILDPKTPPDKVKDLFQEIVTHQSPELKKIINCPPMMLSLSEFLTNERQQKALALLPKGSKFICTKEEILDKVRTNTTGETLDLANLDPALNEQGVKELFIGIISNVPNNSSLKQIINCPSFTLKSSEITKNDLYRAIALLPKDQHIKLNVDQSITYDCSQKWSIEFADGLNNKNITFTHLILENSNNEFLEILKHTSVTHLALQGNCQITEGPQARKAIKTMSPDEITVHCSTASKNNAASIDLYKLHDDYNLIFKISPQKTEQNKEAYEEMVTSMDKIINFFEENKFISFHILNGPQSYGEDHLKNFTFQGLFKKKQSPLL